MGLYINKKGHPEVFQNPNNIHESNQGYAKIDYLSELIKGQKEAYESLHHSFHDLKNLHQQQENTQISQWKDIGKQLKELQENHHQQKEFESHVMEWLTKVDDENRKLQGMMENEGQLKQEMIEQITIISQSNQEIMNRLGQYESSNHELTLKINEQLEHHNQISEQFSKHEDVQNEVLTRLDSQEALTEKILRQINHIRSILFERTNYLAEKIESGYKVTSSYVYKLMTGSDKPLTLFLMNQKEEEAQENSE